MINTNVMASFMPQSNVDMFGMGRMSGAAAGANSAIRQGLAEWKAQQAPLDTSNLMINQQKQIDTNKMAIAETAAKAKRDRIATAYPAGVGTEPKIYDQGGMKLFGEQTIDPETEQLKTNWASASAGDPFSAMLTGMMFGGGQMPMPQTPAAPQQPAAGGGQQFYSAPGAPSKTDAMLQQFLSIYAQEKSAQDAALEAKKASLTNPR
jgi:hypothetical protein